MPFLFSVQLKSSFLADSIKELYINYITRIKFREYLISPCELNMEYNIKMSDNMRTALKKMSNIVQEAIKGKWKIGIWTTN